MRPLLLLSSLCMSVCWANADNYVVGPGATLTLHSPVTLNWSVDGETTSAKGTSFTWKANGTPRIVFIRGTGTQAAQNIEHRVEIVPARLEVKRQNSFLPEADRPWRTATSIVTGGVHSDEDYVRYRVVFPNQKDPLRPLPVGPIIFAPTLKDGSHSNIKPRILPETPTTGRILSGNWADSRLKIRISGSQNPEAAALLFQEDGSTWEFSAHALIRWNQPQKISFTISYYMDEFLGGSDWSIPPAPLRKQKISLSPTCINVLRWDMIQRDFIATNVTPDSPEWKQVSSLVQFSPSFVSSPTATYDFTRSVRFDPRWIINTVSVSALIKSQLNYNGDKQSDATPTFAARLKSPGQPPSFPSFSREKVRQMLAHVEEGDNAPLLRVGLFGGYLQAPTSLNDGLLLVQSELKRTALNSRRWLLLQRLRAWGLLHKEGGKEAALAVYAGTLGRSKIFLAQGNKADVTSVYNDWQDAIDGPFITLEPHDKKSTQAALSAFETFLRLGLSREMPFDQYLPFAIWDGEGFASRVAKLEKDPAVTKDAWFRLGAGEVLANCSFRTEKVGPAALNQLNLAKALLPSDDSSAWKRFYAAMQYAAAYIVEPAPSVPDVDIATLNADKSFGQQARSGYTPLSHEERKRLENIRDNYQTTLSSYYVAKSKQIQDVAREAIARTGEGYDWLFKLHFPGRDQDITPQTRSLLAEIGQKALFSEVLPVATKLSEPLYDPDWDLWNFRPAPPTPEFVEWTKRRAQNQRQRDIDRDHARAARALLVEFLMTKRARTPEDEFNARLQLARFDRDHGHLEQAREWVSPTAPKGKSFDDYRAAQKALKPFASAE